ncbi:MAG: hypothetical protein HYZ75_13465 [Elusimicrobia bacterium]|nr:hypothetical protein [Elusimicrobiota bacterium]
MHPRRLRLRTAALLVAALLKAAAGEAKIVFTGYGNFQMTAHQSTRIHGDAPALAAFKLTETSAKARGFALDSVGLFATTNLKENLDFLVDFTYRKIGSTTGETRIQYAFLEHTPRPDWRYRIGKITLPFGYYNQKRFYSFQRVELSAPIFQSAILGLPISDVGATLQKRFESKAGRVEADVYAVNGYGATPADSKKFRSATLPGAISLASNLVPSNNNENIALGGRLGLARIAGRDLEAGGSYYGGAWEGGGTSKLFQMANGHVHAGVGGLDFLAEYLHLDVLADPGFAAAVGDSHWTTDGYFMTASYPLWQVRGMPLIPFVSSEGYVTRGVHGGGGQERLQGYRAGLCLLPLENIRVKLEYGYLKYVLPLVGLGDLKLDSHSALLAMTLAF